MFSIIPQDLVCVFDEGQLELLLNGLPTISLGDFRANVRYSGYSASDKVLCERERERERECWLEPCCGDV